MGHGRWSSNTWSAWAARNTAGRSASEIFATRTLLPEFDPARIAVRESRDSDDNPRSTPIVLASDVTGSLGEVARILMQDKLGLLVAAILARKPVTDPHIMAMAVGDAFCDQAPLQATQFEADIRLAEQMRRLFVEGGGGGNGGESYALPWLFCGLKTALDSVIRRKKKGYLFSFGDEPIHPVVTRDQAKRFVGVDLERDVTAAECLDLARRSFEVFHVVLRSGFSAGEPGFAAALASWRPLLGERVLVLDNYENLAELVVSTMQVAEGADANMVAASWADAGAAASVRGALGPWSHGR